MDYWLKLLLSVSGIFIVCPAIRGECWTQDFVDGCTYTVVCQDMPSHIDNSYCGGQLNVTFIVQKITSASLYNGIFYETNNAFDSRVRHFIAISNDWSVVENKALAYYKYCLSVDLSENNIRGIHNEAFLGLIHMKYLDLSNNKIAALTKYSLKMTSDSTTTSALEILDLSNNDLTSLNTAVFDNIPLLQELYLQYNKINKLSDNCFQNLRNLRHLEIQNNQIDSLNTSLVSSNKLKLLDISSNNINKLHGFELISLTSLVSLNLSSNNIESMDPSTFKKLASLKVLDLSYNKINSFLEEDVFANNQELSWLKLYHNNLANIAPNVFQLSKLSYLNLQNNNLTSAITKDTFKGLRNITSLNITGQHLEAIRNYAFSQIENLRYLNLSHNFINVIENSSFVNATSLNVLDLSHNKIVGLDFFKMFSSNLTEIYINNNNLDVIPEKAFANHKMLRTLDIANNLIKNIAQYAFPLQNLISLEMHHNKLSGSVVHHVFSPAKLIKNVDISNFQLETLNELALTDLPLVERVNISHNNLSFIHPSNFRDVDHMLALDASYNNLKYIELDTKLNELQSIYLNNNRLTSIPNLFGNGSKLEYLDCSHNNISNITNTMFENTRQLQVLDLSFNHLTHFNNKYTNGLLNLAELNLVSNQVKEMVNISYFKHLLHLNISNNEITYITKSHFGISNSLTALSLNGNKIKTLDPGTFQYLPSLNILEISKNNIKTVRFGTFSGLNATNVIDISRNNIQYLDPEMFHECLELQTLIIDYNNISTVDADKILIAVPSIKVISLGGNPLDCREVIQNKRKSSNITFTALEKVYHEDNIHGIKCDQKKITVETKEIVVKTQDPMHNMWVANIAITWCGILGGLLSVGFITFYCTRRYSNQTNQNRIRMQFQNSNEINTSECHGDLMS